MSETIFAGDPPAVVAPAPPVTPSVQVPTELVEFVGVGKKYQSVEDALKSVPHAQQHISTLEAENARIKAELESRRTTEELLAEIRSGITPAVVTPTQTGYDPAQIEQTVTSLLARKEATTKAQNNINTVVSRFTEVFGDRAKAEEEYNKLAASAGLDVPTLNSLAATSPEAVLKLAGMSGQPKQGIPGKPVSTVNTAALNGKPTDKVSARVPLYGASTKDVTAAWRAAGELARQKLEQNN